MNERNDLRVVLRARTIVNYNDNPIEAELENISLNGIFVSIDEDIPVHSDVALTLDLTGRSSELILNLNGTVLRENDEGFAIVFKEVNPETELHLKSIVDNIVKIEEDKIVLDFEKSEIDESIKD
ncbi:MAG: PilZ domain-containing protein [bacterium]|nr:PilZ domain-containing protein [bacterium]